ncbi:Hypothetical predicted protein [Paramuricea clavata]|uniref:DUF5641 domain-containing protein n=1 Tax=Paramuricea clavata TaxID=317549 RepID=A0A7D9I0S0_PARCT|nr:Hypothetical predicted protein [Paramuricea clavata]
MFWKLARVKELIKSQDGVVRAAKICVVNSAKERVIELRRPIQHLIPLELKLSPDTEDVPPAIESASKEKESTIQRPRRTAAVVGELLRKGMR